jgi:competence protein ComEA
MAIRERLDSLSRGELAGLVVVLVATLAGVGLWYSRSLPKPIQIAETPPPTFLQAASGSASGVPAAGSPGASASPPADLIIDVTGWVRHPGVYQFQPGSRVIDAVQRAGGARDGADLTLLNLAAPHADGQQILVPKEGASASGAAAGGTGVGGVALVNINTADEPTLETLNGVGPALAAAIIQFRTDQGPFTSVDQLDEVSGIGPATLEKLRPQVTV